MHAPLQGGVEHSRRHRTWATIAALYLAQSIPSYLLIMAVPAALRAQGMSLTQIGLLSVLMLPLLLKFLWAPWVDHQRFGRWGHRRGWILITQLGCCASIAALAWAKPGDLYALIGIGMCVALCIATQDIATDGYATSTLRDQAQRATGNGIQAGSVAAGVLIGGMLSMQLFERWGWQPTLWLMAALCLLPLLVLPWMHEGNAPQASSARALRPSVWRMLQRPGVWAIVLLAMSYRLSEGMVRAMENSYMLAHGLSLSEVGTLSGMAAVTAGLLGSAVAAWWLRRSAQLRVLLALCVLRVLCYVLFGLHASGHLGASGMLVGLALMMSVLRYMEMVALYALYMQAASPQQPGTDFTVFVCAELLTYMISSMAGGAIAQQLSFTGLFVTATALGLMSLWVTPVLLRRARPVMAGH
jgi:RhtX/FptX family siderophore transporter